MKKFIAFLFALPLAVFAASAFSPADGDAIVGNWLAVQDGVSSHASITRSADGTYKCQLYWVEDSIGPDGKKYLDVKNPDKNLRSVPVDKVVLFTGLKYDASKKQWSGAKIYDPTRGIRANVTCTLVDGDTLRLKGTVLGIGETVTWTRIKD